MKVSRAANAVATTVICAAISVWFAAPASSQVLQWTDTAGDMWSFTEQAPAPAETNGDIRKVTINHRKGAVVIRVTYTTLDRIESGMTPIRGRSKLTRAASTGSPCTGPGPTTTPAWRRATA